MKNQEGLIHTKFDDPGFAKRLAHVLYLSGLNQTEFANRIGVSGGFISDAVRGLKKPGAEILASINKVYGISIDWLLNGKGSLHGDNLIDIELLRDIRTQVGIVNEAIIQKNPTAQKILQLLQTGDLNRETATTEIVDFLENLSLTELEFDLAVELYNEFVQTENQMEARKNLLNTVTKKVQMRKPKDKLAQIMQSAAPVISVNIIGEQINVKGNYNKN